MLDRLFALETFGIKLGLENITRLCDALGHPERAYPVAHVAGTNGKGSVTAMVHAALRAAGLHAARYTSPHLVTLSERFVIGDDPVSDDDLQHAAATVLDLADRMQADGSLAVPPTFFEATTAIAFELFRRAQVHAAVIEVGLGGRFDATNVVRPAVTAITSIALDHQQHLGPTIERIAHEKAGIIKPGVPVVTGHLPADAFAVVADTARDRGVPLITTDDIVLRTSFEDGRATIDVRTCVRRYEGIRLALRGEHQVRNALVAIRTLELLAERGLSIGADAIASGLASAEWAARLERFDFADGTRVLLDAAHNPEGAAALAGYLRRWHPEKPLLVFAAMKDKDVAAVLRELLPHVGHVFVTAPDTVRAMPPDGLAECVRTIDPGRQVHVIEPPSAALGAALARSRTVCVAGSIFLAGAVRDGLRRRAILH